jgi:flavin reductase (DIM6/NTAB) family NADH-FMN oxidoreductase RutF
VYLRPQRYTREFVDREELFTLSVFPEEYRKALGYLGSHSGRDGDKVAAAGLTPVFEGEFTTFAEAKLTLVCRKLYRGTIQPEGFEEKSIIADHYPNSDFHIFYIGQIVKAFIAD